MKNIFSDSIVSLDQANNTAAKRRYKTYLCNISAGRNTWWMWHMRNTWYIPRTRTSTEVYIDLFINRGRSGNTICQAYIHCIISLFDNNNNMELLTQKNRFTNLIYIYYMHILYK